MPPFIQARPEGVYLAIKVQPRASKNAIGEVLGSELKVKVTAPPVDSAANEALVEFLVETLGCARGAVRIVRGQTSRHKQVLVVGVAADEIARRLCLEG
jgi:uncharacterized protein (TIGR00251 family)